MASLHGPECAFLARDSELTPQSHVLDLCSGIGGPARYLARTYGCRVTGIDLSEFNHRTASLRTKAAGLDELVDFHCGDALDPPFPNNSFSHVFGCEAWCYFPDKVQLYRVAHRMLKSAGMVGFLEAACDAPVVLRAGEHLGAVQYESIADYSSKLQEAGFCAIRTFDTTELASRDVAGSINRLIARRDRVMEEAGSETYFALLEIWAEFLACFCEGRLTHCGVIARKISFLPNRSLPG